MLRKLIDAHTQRPFYVNPDHVIGIDEDDSGQGRSRVWVNGIPRPVSVDGSPEQVAASLFTVWTDRIKL